MAQHNLAGAKAERLVADWLRSENFKILDTNWKTKWCEIDIIAQKDKCVYFIEVKYRSTEDFGGGFDYITPSKQKKMDLAGRSWIVMNDWQGEHVLSAAEVSGTDFKINFIEEI